MHYSRQRPRVAPTGRISIRLTTWQRDLLMAAATTPKDLGHVLHRAPVRGGKLSIRVTRETLEALIATVAKSPAPQERTERDMKALLGYLETLEDRFEQPDEAEADEHGEHREESPSA